MENYILPKIVDRGGELSQRWFVEYKYKHPETNKFIKFREWISAKITTRQARYKKAVEIKNRLTLKLKQGFTPFETEERQIYLAAALQHILKIKSETCGKRAKSSYNSLAGLFIAWLQKNNLESLKANEFNKRLAQRFLDYLLINKKISNRTYNNYLAALRTLFAALLERDFVDFNVWQGLKKLKVKQADLTALSVKEQKFIKENLPAINYPLYCCALLIYYCYLRPAEIVRLRVADIDFTRGQILVKASQSKNGCNQTVIMHPDLVAALLRLNLAKFPENYFVFGTSKALNPSPTEIAPTRIADAWREQFKKPFNFTKNIYDLKPTGNGAAVESGIDLRTIQLQNRHHSLEQTQKYLDKFMNKPGEVFRDKMRAFA